MKFLLTCALVFTSAAVFAQRALTDSWYKIKMDDYPGYVHYIVTEEAEGITTTLDFGLRMGSRRATLKGFIHSRADQFLTVKDFEFVSTGGKSGTEPERITGTASIKDTTIIWKAAFSGTDAYTNNQKTEETAYPTLTNLNVWYILSTLDYSHQGRILSFNSMEISELHYKPNHYLDYVGNETITVGGKKILAKKITHNGEGISETIYWLNAENRMVKMSMDGYKIYELCRKEDIDMKDFAQ